MNYTIRFLRLSAGQLQRGEKKGFEKNVYENDFFSVFVFVLEPKYKQQTRN